MAATRVGLEHRLDVRAGELSSGERRRLELARAVTRLPRVLVCDEPFAGVDPVGAERLGRPASGPREGRRGRHPRRPPRRRGASGVLARHSSARRPGRGERAGRRVPEPSPGAGPLPRHLAARQLPGRARRVGRARRRDAPASDSTKRRTVAPLPAMKLGEFKQIQPLARKSPKSPEPGCHRHAPVLVVWEECRGRTPRPRRQPHASSRAPAASGQPGTGEPS